MKKLYCQLVVGLLVCFASNCVAQPVKEKKAPGAIGFITDAIQNAEGDTAFNLNGDKFGAFFVPLRSIDLPVASAFDAGVGALVGGGKPEALASVRLNLPQLANGLFGTSWFQRHSHGLTLPSLFMGPAVKAEWPIRNWTWRQDIYFLVGIPFGSVLK